MEAEGSTVFDEIAPLGAGTDGVMANKRGPKPRPVEERRDSSLIVGCRTVWKDWVQRFAKRERTDPAHLADQGLAGLARIKGFDEPPYR
jgi:hypothetical protein